MEINTLIKKISEKDQESFILLYNMLSNKIKTVAFNVLRDSQKSEDIVQEVMITIWKKASSFVPFENGERWILKIAKNKAISVLRKLKKEISVDFKDEKTVNTLNYINKEFISNFEDEIEISILLESLTPNERLVFAMKYDKYSADVITNVSGLTKRQVVYEYKKALQKLKKNIMIKK